MLRIPTPGPGRARICPRTSIQKLHMHRLALLVFCALAAFSGPAAAQLQYPEGTFFLNGLNERSRWSDYDIGGRLNQRVDLGPYRYTELSTHQPVATQSRELREWYLDSRSGKGVLVGHSMGGVVARDAVLNPDGSINSADKVAGIVSVVSPHQGAPIAANARRIDGISGKQLIEGFLHTIITAKLNPITGLVDLAASTVLHALIENVFVNGVKKFVVEVFGDRFGLNAAADDLKPGSATMQRLGSTSDYVEHASVYGTIPKRNMVYELVAGMNYQDAHGFIKKKNIGRGMLKGCKLIFYNIIVKSAVGHSCHVGDRAIGSLEERWVDWTGAKNDQADGLLPRSTMLYPGESEGSTRNVHVPGQNHFSIVYRDAGLDGVARGMHRIGMRSR